MKKLIITCQLIFICLGLMCYDYPPASDPYHEIYGNINELKTFDLSKYDGKYKKIDESEDGKYLIIEIDGKYYKVEIE